MSANDNQSVADQIGALFDALEVARVVAVDDYYPNAAVDIGDLTLALVSGDIDLADFVALPDVPWSGTHIEAAEEAADLLRQEWDALGEEQRAQLAALRTASAPVEAEAEAVQPPVVEQNADAATITHLREFFPTHVEFLTVSATHWQDQGETILNQPGTTLVFFDLDLRHEHLSATAGADLLRKVQRRPDTSAIAGILTHEAASADAERSLNERLREQYDLDPFPLLGKGRAEDATQFLDGLRTYLIIAQVQQHAGTIARSIQDGVDAARQALEQIDAYDFITAMQNARYEGVYELDGPLRIANRAIRRETVAALGRHVDPGTLAVLRTAAAIIVPLDESHAEQEHARRWEHAYDDSDYVNGNHLPLEVGDVFLLTRDGAAASYYVLLMQPCDLSLREGGKRSTSLKQFTLAKLRQTRTSGSVASHAKVDRPAILSPDITDRTDWEVNLADLLHIPDDVLDLVVFDTGGRAVMNAANLTGGVLQESWNARGRTLENRRVKHLDEVKKLGGSLARVDGVLRQRFIDKITRNELGLTSSKLQAQFDEEAAEIRFNVCRVGRMTTPIANQVLTSAGQRQYRPALEYDLFGENWRQ